MLVLVHADDLGMSPAVNEAIFGAFAEGILRSCSVMATGPAFQPAVAERPPGLDVGVHLDLTGFPALSGAPVLEALRGDVAARPEQAKAALIRLAQAHMAVVEAEWVGQVERVRAAGIHPSHLDSHQHVHWLPAYWPILRAVARRTGIRRVRGVGAWRPEVGMVRGAPQHLRSLRFRAAFGGFVLTDGFASASVARERLAQGRRGGRSLEVMVHPGNPAHARYADELAWLRTRPWGSTDRLVSWDELG